jgi:hypothetical protein
VGERFILGPGGDAEPALRRAVSSGGGREFPADPRYRVVLYGPGQHAVYREIELTAADLGIPGPVRDKHGRTILAIEGLAVTGDPARRRRSRQVHAFPSQVLLWLINKYATYLTYLTRRVIRGNTASSGEEHA